MFQTLQDFLLQWMCVPSGAWIILCYQRNRNLFQGSDTDYQYCASGRCLADTNHVDYDSHAGYMLHICEKESAWENVYE